MFILTLFFDFTALLTVETTIQVDRYTHKIKSASILIIKPIVFTYQIYNYKQFYLFRSLSHNSSHGNAMITQVSN